MTVLVCRQEAGAVWIEDAEGAMVAPCFFKTAEETEDELQAMGYPRLLTVSPAVQIVVAYLGAADNVSRLLPKPSE